MKVCDGFPPRQRAAVSTARTDHRAGQRGGIGAYIGSLIGALGQMEQLERDNTSVENLAEPSGPLIAVNAVDEKVEQDIIGILMRCSPLQVDRANGNWEHGEWADFNPHEPVETLHRADPVQAMRSAGVACRSDILQTHFDCRPEVFGSSTSSVCQKTRTRAPG
jgi:hypothetical protein